MANILTVDDVKERVLRSLTEQERRTSVVYLDRRVHLPGTEVTLGNATQTLAAATIVVFSDDEPGMNWSHRCRYRLFAADTGAEWQIEASFPPPRRESDSYQLIWKPTGVEDWALWKK